MTLLDNLVRRTQVAGVQLYDRLPGQRRAFAEPPPDSDLKPVLGKPGAPLFGYAPTILYDSIRWGRKVFAETGPVSWTNFGPTPVVFLLGPEALEIAWMNRDKALTASGLEFFIGPFFHRGLLLLDFEEHLEHRRIMQQAFSRPRLDDYMSRMKPTIERELASWRPGDDFHMYTCAKQSLLRLATEVFVGTTSGPESRRIENAFVDCLNAGLSVIRFPLPGNAWSRGLAGRRTLDEYFHAQIPAKRAGDGVDLFSVLCNAEDEEGQRFSDDDIVNHMRFVMLAAHDTSTITLSMMTYLLGKHPEWQERVRAESEALGKPALDVADLDRLPSLDLVFKETLRMFAPAGGLAREAIKDTEILGHYIPAGTKVLLQPFVSMRLEKWWPNPDTFDPERFADDRREDRVHRFAWSPFGGGAHKCIGLYFGGMTVKAIMHQMLLKYRWSVPANYEPPLEWGTGPVPSDGLPIRLETV
ncbi:cytochrome P450 [Smaragdicoccus niigatensis]|uniref:cytochrome P450 n=1 Tax=Smaragdicoccus niigatensis TaxID=359359 RepID=UPI0003684C34|nr:cytochrome P450 [Smaragdicoccus niigatensis]